MLWGSWGCLALAAGQGCGVAGLAGNDGGKEDAAAGADTPRATDGSGGCGGEGRPDPDERTPREDGGSADVPVGSDATPDSRWEPSELPPDDGPPPILRPNPIPAENALPGGHGWRLNQDSHNREIEAYGRQPSLVAGEELEVAVSVQPAPARFNYSVWRLGHYEGAGGRLLAEGGPVEAQPQPMPVADPDTGVVECRWPTTFRVPIGEDWVSGAYVVVLTREEGWQTRVPFVVRDDRQAALYFVHAMTTWQAYNRWGGTSLYGNDGNHPTWSRPRAFAVSFDRPYGTGGGTGELFSQEVPMLRWLEAHGYDVTYGTNFDVHHGRPWASGRAVLSVGHDEYWTVEMRDKLEQTRERGTHLAFFSANTGYWRVRLQPASDGKPDRTMVSYKYDAVELDPVGRRSPAEVTGLWRGPAMRPENALIGVMFDAWQILSVPMVVHADADHWLLQGTGLRRHDVIWNVIGIESDRTYQNGFTPPGAEVIMRSPVVSHFGTVTKQEATIYQAPSGAWVFGGGSITFALGVSGDTADSRMEHLVANLLRRFGAGEPDPPLPPPTAPPARPAPPPNVVVSTLAGGGGEGHQDGPGDVAAFAGPGAVAVAPDGSIIVADTAGRRIRQIANDAARTVTTIAGDGELGEVDGPGRYAQFVAPTGVAVDARGAIYVVDAALYVIRRIAPASEDPERTVTTLAGRAWYAGLIDGPGTEARFANPTGIALGADGALYVADLDSNTIRRMETVAPYQVTAVAGDGQLGLRDGPGREAQFSFPSGIAAGPDGSLYVLDTQNCAIRKIAADAARTVSTLYAGQGCDGGGLQTFAGQHGIALDAARNRLVLADTANYRIVTLPLSGGEPEPLVGDGTYDLTGPDGLSIVLPLDVAIGPNGDIVVADTGHFKIRRIVQR